MNIYYSELLEKIWFYGAPLLEIAMLAFLIYYVLYFLRGTRSANILAGIVIAVLLLAFMTDKLKLGVLNWLLNGLWAIFPFALIVIFQPELRRAFAQLGSRHFGRKSKREDTINEVVAAVRYMSRLHIGALIVFKRQIGMNPLISNGVFIEARVVHSLIQTIFHPNTPLHDGGIVIEDDRIIATHIIFPLSQNPSLSTSLGTRHRAALGITEETDAVAVVVSGETGKISVACRGNIIKDVTPEEVTRYLFALLITSREDEVKELIALEEEYDNEKEDEA